MPTYYDGYEGHDSFEHKYYVMLRNSGFDIIDSNLFAIVAVERDRNKSLSELIKRDGVKGLLTYARAHWPNLCNWIQDAWERIKSFFGF